MAAVAAAPVDTLSGLPTFFDAPTTPPYTLLELRLIKLGGSIRNKRNWTLKMKDPEIVERYAAEARQQGVPEDELQYVLKEQRFWASKFPGPLAPAAVPGIYLADDLIPEDLVAGLSALVGRLEGEEEKDWHPGSDEQVLDLVHPSLYPVVFGTTLVLPEGSPPLTLATCLSAIGSGEPAQPPPPAQFTSTQFQWLPALFEVSPEGAVEVKSYINNLHPQVYADAYPVLAQVFARLVPLFEGVLTDLLNPRPRAIKVDPYAWYGDMPKGLSEEEEEEWYENRVPLMPAVPEAFEGPPEPSKVADLRGRKLQVIVKLANIHLTPEKPSYPGGSWHIEGMINESIVATGIFYHSQENITESALAFRTAVDEYFDYEQNDHQGVTAMYGLADEGPLNQFLGAVSSLPGRCICFPNTLQHRVQPFELEDKARPGHRKMLLYWLVDPSKDVKLSTVSVPPQQINWLKEEVFNNNPTRTRTWLPHIPNAARAVVEEKLDMLSTCPYSVEEAKTYREALMKERKVAVVQQNEEHFELTLSLCEH